ncbi:MAG: T9SS type A sorting domain-containing protein [Flavobacteriales bacterium]|nr:T9SS type A sorting domain-containing protein [Flavobacteriales bacterium]
MQTNRTLIPAALLIVSSPAVAQTLTGATNNPQIGDSFVLQYSTPLSPGGAGTGQTWDFSAATVDSTETQYFVDPQGTPGFSTVPNADLAITTDFASYGYWIANNSTWTDTYGFAFDADGLQVTSSGSAAAEADGLGTLITPYGTVSNVLRIRQENEETTLITGIGELNVESTQYLYVKPGVRFPLAIVSTSISTVFGIPGEPVNDMVWLDGSTVGLAEAAHHAIGVELYPNPAKDRITITYGASSSAVQVDVIDAAGHVVRTEQLSQQPIGINRVDLPLNNVPAGIYLVRILADNGDQGVQRLVIE